MRLCLFEDDQVRHLFPLTYTRPAYDLRLGMRSLREILCDAFEANSLFLHTRPYLRSTVAAEAGDTAQALARDDTILFVNGRYVAEEGPVLDRLRAAASPSEGPRVFVQDDDVIAAWVPRPRQHHLAFEVASRATFGDLPEETVKGARLIGRLGHLLAEIEPAIRRDFRLRTHGYNVYERPGAHIHDGVHLINPEEVFAAPGAVIRPGAVLNAEEGPIYVDEQGVVHENAVVVGPAYVGKKAQVLPAAIVGHSAVGTWSKVGGEVHGSVLHSLSNKAHAGYLGDSYLGRWCNLGADTNTSNLRNDYGNVSLYDAAEGDFVDTGAMFVGIFMGDHSKCGINTMFNTGTVVGVSCNIFGAGFQPRFVPSFAWGGGADLSHFAEYRLDKALQVADRVMRRRETYLTDAERQMMEEVFAMTARGRLYLKG